MVAAAVLAIVARLTGVVDFDQPRTHASTRYGVLQALLMICRSCQLVCWYIGPTRQIRVKSIIAQRNVASRSKNDHLISAYS